MLIVKEAKTHAINDEVVDVETNNIEKSESAEKVVEKKIRAEQVSETNILIDSCAYRIVTNYREAFNIELLSERYSDVLNRYEYIVGDMGFEQLRLRGFFSEEHMNMPAEQRISNLADYLYEYCNFGCPYFVLERMGEHSIKENKQRSKRPQSRRTKQTRSSQAHINEKRTAQVGQAQAKETSNRKTPVVKKRQDNNTASTKVETVKSESTSKPEKGRGFTIRKKNN